MLLPCYYNAPISWFSLLISSSEKEISMEQHDHYSRQTYRNRCKIYGPNGTSDLIVPVKKISGEKRCMKDIEIDYDTPWNRTHLRSIQSAYSAAPYFEYIIDLYIPIYEKSYKYLIDLNIDLLELHLDVLNTNKKIKLTEVYKGSELNEDISALIHPKRPFTSKEYNYNTAWYQQVYADRYGFKKDLSIVDLLMNEGSDARTILSKSLKIYNAE